MLLIPIYTHMVTKICKISRSISKPLLRKLQKIKGRGLRTCTFYAAPSTYLRTVVSTTRGVGAGLRKTKLTFGVMDSGQAMQIDHSHGCESKTFCSKLNVVIILCSSLALTLTLTKRSVGHSQTRPV